MTRFRITILPAALVLTAALFGPALTASHAAGPDQHSATAGQQLWVQRYRGPASPANGAASAVMSRDGKTVFVTGYSIGNGGSAFATVAYRTSTGARLWVARYDSGGRFFSGGAAHSIALSPDGTMVFVTGNRLNSKGGSDYATVAYRAATGKQVWAARYDGPVRGEDSAVSVAVSPSGDTVFVTGSSQGSGSAEAYATVAYRAATGTQLWVKRFSGTGKGLSLAAAVAVSPNGHLVFVTGQSPHPGVGSDYLTVAYRASTGKLQWRARYNGPGNGDDFATAVRVSRDGNTVLVTGSSYGGPATGRDWATIAYRATSGTTRWVSRYNGPASGDDSAASLAVDPDGARVYVTGSSTGKTSGADATTVAYRTATGAQSWAKHYSGPGPGADTGNSVTTNPDGSKVFITGMVSTKLASNGNYLTIGYRAATGAQLWSSRYNGPANSLDVAEAVVASATRVVVTGVSFRILGNPGFSSYATIGYKA